MKQQWVIGKMTHAFLAAMERILWLYAQPYNPKRPVVCFDERPCFLIGDAVELIAMQTGRIRKSIMPMKRMALVPFWQRLNR
ncbi:MAG: hypothetical protein M5U34_07705 [Chloroflexi bacterium]|nr:hypothetical protein [Chloroflexota bacterium]